MKKNQKTNIDCSVATSAEQFPKGGAPVASPFVGPLIPETRETFISGIFASKNGRIFNNKKEYLVHNRKTTGPKGGKYTYVNVRIYGKEKVFAVSKLVASAWIDGFDVSSDRIRYKDDDAFNCNVENLQIVKPGEPLYSLGVRNANEAKRKMREEEKTKLDSYGFEWGKCSFPGLECTRDGLFRYKGYAINSYVRTSKLANGKVARHRFLMINIEGKHRGKSVRLTASKMVASAWKMYNPDTDFIIYKDGDSTNINMNNLQVVDEKAYNKFLINRTRKEHTDSERYANYYETCKNVVHDSQMTLRFLDTGDFSEINAYLEKTVIPRLEDYIRFTLKMPEFRVRVIMTAAIDVLYSKLDEGRPMCNYYGFLRNIALRYKLTKGKLPFWMYEHPDKPYSNRYRMSNEDALISTLSTKFNVVRQNGKKSTK